MRKQQPYIPAQITSEEEEKRIQVIYDMLEDAQKQVYDLSDLINDEYAHLRQAYTRIQDSRKWLKNRIDRLRADRGTFIYAINGMPLDHSLQIAKVSDLLQHAWALHALPYGTADQWKLVSRNSCNESIFEFHNGEEIDLLEHNCHITIPETTL